MLKHLKHSQHTSIIIQIIFRELGTYAKRYAAASPHLTFHIFKF